MSRIRVIAGALAAWLVAGGGVAAAAPAKVYVANEGSDSVSVVDAAGFRIMAVVPVGKKPHNVQVSPDGTLAWVTNEGGPREGELAHAGMAKGEHEAMGGQGEVWAIDTATDRVVARIAVGRHPAHVVLSPNGRYAFVTNGGEDTVSVVDTGARKAIATIPVGAYPHGLRLSPSGREAYVANLKGDTVSVIDTEAKREVATIAVGKGPAQVAFTPDGRLAFASLSRENAVAVIDPVTREVRRKIPVGRVPIQLYATPDSRLLFVANQGTKQQPDRTVSVIDLARLAVVKTVETGPGAHGVVVSGDGRYAFVTNTYANTLSVIKVGDLAVAATVPVGKEPNGVSVTP